MRERLLDGPSRITRHLMSIAFASLANRRVRDFLAPVRSIQAPGPPPGRDDRSVDDQTLSHRCFHISRARVLVAIRSISRTRLSGNHVDRGFFSVPVAFICARVRVRPENRKSVVGVSSVESRIRVEPAAEKRCAGDDHSVARVGFLVEKSP